VIPALALVLAACAAPQPPPAAERADPLEPVNRGVHQFNRATDRALFRPFSVAYGTVLPGYVRDKVDNAYHNLLLPGEVVNAGLQGRAENSGHNLFRFLLNSTLGVFGIFDPATSFGLERRETDFGETLYVWGVGEGPYVEAPLFGPYTTRAATGEIVDLFLNPLSVIGLDGTGAYISAGTYVLESANFRYEFRDTFDAILYESFDSYTQTRDTYLQNRRFTLERNARDGTGDSGVVDPYAGGATEGGGPVAPDESGQPTSETPAAPPRGDVIDPYEEF